MIAAISEDPMSFKVSIFMHSCPFRSAVHCVVFSCKKV
jgi:hypothetical protein